MIVTTEIDMGIPTTPDFVCTVGGVVRRDGEQVGTVVDIKPKEPMSSVLVFTLDIPDTEVFL